MKYCILVVFYLIITKTALSQHISNNNVFAEIGGSTLLYSINYEKIFASKNESAFYAARAGFMINPFLFDFDFGIPLSVSLLKPLKSKNTYFEFKFSIADIWHKEYVSSGLGDTTGFHNSYIYKNLYISSIGFGYRRQPMKNGLFLSLNIQVSYIDKELLPWIGFGIGYSFKTGNTEKINSN